MLVADHIARRVARIIYEADCHTRHLLTNKLIDCNERSYLGSVAGIANVNLFGLKRFSRNLTLRINTRDSHSYDGIFIFRFDNEVKIGICECKLLRFQDDHGKVVPLSSKWDWHDPKPVSHFYNQISDFNSWSNDCALWYMFMLDLPQGDHCPPLDSKGSSCIWHQEMKNHIRVNELNKYKLWSLQNVIDIGQPPLTNLREIIHELLICNQGNKITINPLDRTASVIYGERQKEIAIPIPGAYIGGQSFISKVDAFLRENKLAFYEYFNMSGMNLVPQ